MSRVTIPEQKHILCDGCGKECAKYVHDSSKPKHAATLVRTGYTIPAGQPNIDLDFCDICYGKIKLAIEKTIELII